MPKAMQKPTTITRITTTKRKWGVCVYWGVGREGGK